MRAFMKRAAGCALTIGMLLSTMTLLHAEDSLIQVNEGVKSTTYGQEHTGYTIKADADMNYKASMSFDKAEHIQPEDQVIITFKAQEEHKFTKDPLITFSSDTVTIVKVVQDDADAFNTLYFYTITGISEDTTVYADFEVEKFTESGVEPQAQVWDVEVKGSVNTPLQPQCILLSLSFTKYNNIAKGTDISSWITNLPKGLTAIVDEDVVDNGGNFDAEKLYVMISGTPLEPSCDPISATIPASAMRSGESMTTFYYKFAAWNITGTAIQPEVKPDADTNKAPDAETGTDSVQGVRLEITKGENSVYRSGLNEPFTLVCSGRLEDLEGIYVNGRILDDSNYTLRSGSTILTLKPEYLKTLATGTYTLRFQYKQDFMDVAFRVENGKGGITLNEKTAAAAPNTADQTAAGMLLCTLMGSGVGIAALYMKRRALRKA